MSEGWESSKMEIDVRKVADLAKTSLPPAEMSQLEKDLRDILGHIQRLSSVDVEGVPPTFGPAKSASLRIEADVPRPCLPREVLLGLAPEVRDGNVLVPREAPPKDESPEGSRGGEGAR